ncbi:MAG: hypothetical protein CL792_02275 [Chloroflexi bacterium]|nr:hypothetical protein [Chloroflexota bacterium]|tara:strand:- start:9809 stop:10111 length:303 start_codon:yes stop_codon:yes gene_type:complete
MPLFTYSCEDCDEQFEKLVRGTKSPEPETCIMCSSSKIRKIPTTFSLSRNEIDALRSLDPMYKRMVEDRMAQTPEAEPMRHLAKMTPFDVAEDPGKPIDF